MNSFKNFTEESINDKKLEIEKFLGELASVDKMFSVKVDEFDVLRQTVKNAQKNDFNVRLLKLLESYGKKNDLLENGKLPEVILKMYSEFEKITIE